MLLLLASASIADDGSWQSLFDGNSLDGWKAADHDECFKVEDGAIVAGGGPMAHLFYVGPVGNHDFKNFELKMDVMTRPGSNGGIFFHTEPQSGALKKGYEAQVCNTHTDKRRTGGLVAIQDIMDTSPVKDDEWFEYDILRVWQANRSEDQWQDDRGLHRTGEPRATQGPRAAITLERPACSSSP